MPNCPSPISHSSSWLESSSTRWKLIEFSDPVCSNLSTSKRCVWNLGCVPRRLGLSLSSELSSGTTMSPNFGFTDSHEELGLFHVSNERML